MSTADGRINELEMRVAHQEKTIAELNEMVTAQWKKTEALERQLRRFAEELDALGGADAKAQERPPHY